MPFLLKRITYDWGIISHDCLIIIFQSNSSHFRQLAGLPLQKLLPLSGFTFEFLKKKFF